MTTISIRIEEATKKAASKMLGELGLDMSSAVNIFLRQVVAEKGLPFTPTKNPAILRAKWDTEVAQARAHGKRYQSASEALRDL
jgi:DNA-damage-inducible protein J